MSQCCCIVGVVVVVVIVVAISLPFPLNAFVALLVHFCYHCWTFHSYYYCLFCHCYCRHHCHFVIVNVIVSFTSMLSLLLLMYCRSHGGHYYCLLPAILVIGVCYCYYKCYCHCIAIIIVFTTAFAIAIDTLRGIGIISYCLKI